MRIREAQAIHNLFLTIFNFVVELYPNNIIYKKIKAKTTPERIAKLTSGR